KTFSGYSRLEARIQGHWFRIGPGTTRQTESETSICCISILVFRGRQEVFVVRFRIVLGKYCSHLRDTDQFLAIIEFARGTPDMGELSAPASRGSPSES